MISRGLFLRPVGCGTLLRFFRSFLWTLLVGVRLTAQLPFYTDDPGVTDAGKIHFEFFNEYDVLQHEQFPNLRQNTANYKLNYGLAHNLEIDIDAPYLAIFRGLRTPTSNGAGDLNLGIKWNFHKQSQSQLSHVPAFDTWPFCV